MKKCDYMFWTVINLEMFEKSYKCKSIVGVTFIFLHPKIPNLHTQKRLEIFWNSAHWKFSFNSTNVDFLFKCIWNETKHFQTWIAFSKYSIYNTRLSNPQYYFAKKEEEKYTCRCDMKNTVWKKQKFTRIWEVFSWNRFSKIYYLPI